MKKITYFYLLLLTAGINRQLSAQDSVFFEKPTNEIRIDTLHHTNLWQIGKPQKPFFVSAYSPPNAIVTDTINSYPPNDTSSFIYVIRQPYTQSCYTCMEFWQKYDMDSIGDKGIIEASYDGGNSWLTVKDTFNVPPSYSNFQWNSDYHETSMTSTPHKLITTGKSDGWIQSQFCWQWWIGAKRDTIIPNPDSLMIRFTFISDTVTHHKDGWMIDNIVTEDLWYMCGGIAENNLNEDVVISPNPFTSLTTISFSAEQTNTTIKITDILGKEIKAINFTGKELIIMKGTMQAGIYFVQITDANKNIVNRKVLVE